MQPKAMAFNKRIFRIECHVKNDKMTVTQRYNLRQQRTKPITISRSKRLNPSSPRENTIELNIHIPVFSSIVFRQDSFPVRDCL